MGTVQRIITGLSTAAVGSLGAASARFYVGSRRAERAWTGARFPKLNDAGAVKRLSILPLIDWYADRDDLVGEPGVSYLIRADDTNILLDTGLNQRGEHPAPLLRNMAALGIRLADINLLVISHNHADHMGGRMGSVALSRGPVDLPDVPVFVPAPVKIPTARPVVVEGPRCLATGVITTGPIANQDFMFGWTLEQSLAFNVEGKGIVIVIGCGHPGVDRIIGRVEMLLDAPIYGVVGGLHYPVTASRWMAGPLPFQKIFGTGKWPWKPIGREDVKMGMASIGRRQPKLVALSAHDSCDWSLDAFRREFPNSFQDVAVGREIVVQ